MERGRLTGLPRRRARCRQDVRHARRGPPPGRAGHRRGHRAGRDPRPGQDRRRPSAAWRSCRGGGLDYRGVTGRPSWTWPPCSPAARGRAGRRAGPHQRASTRPSPAGPRQALAGRRDAARRRHRRHHHGQRPAPRVPQRRGGVDHRHPADRDRARRGRPRRRRGRAGRHEPAVAAATDGPRQHLCRRQGRYRALAATSARATSPPCASWPCCGWPTGSTRGWTATATRTASTAPGPPGSGWWSRCPAPPESTALMRRAARIATRSAGAEWLAVYVTRRDGLSGVSADSLEQLRAKAHDLGGSFHAVVASDVAEGLLDFARGVNATQVLIGASRRSRICGAAPTRGRRGGHRRVRRHRRPRGHP